MVDSLEAIFVNRSQSVAMTDRTIEKVGQNRYAYYVLKRKD